MDILKKKRSSITVVGIVMIIIVLLFSKLNDFSLFDSLISLPKAFIWMTENFYPTLETMKKLPSIMDKLYETIFLSIAATTTAGVFATIFGLFGSKVLPVHSSLAYSSIFISSVFRNIPVVAWAMLLLFSFGQNVLTGYFALFFVTFGFLTRAFREAMNEANPEAIEALQATGATYLQIVFQAILPSSLPQMISWILFMIETNIRSSTLVGLLTGTGIGFSFGLYYKSMRYNEASLVVVVIVLTVLIIESISNYVRRIIL